MKQKMFQITHDQIYHNDFHRTYNWIISLIYIRQLIKRLRTYITYCFEYQFNQTKRYFIYEKLTSIMSLFISFYIIIINWIILLSIIKVDFNILFIITCKFIKRILLIFDKNIWKIYEWTKIIIIVFVNHNWKTFIIIINDKNFRFMSNFWKIVVKKFRTFMLIFIAWHFQTNN